MTREQAIKELTELLPEEFLSEYAEAIRMAIKALEQEPCDDAVSRDKAIVQLSHLQSDWDDDWNVPIRKCIETIKIVPPVTPQQKMGSSSEKPNKWIPITSRPMTEEEKEHYKTHPEYQDDYRIFNCKLPDDGQEVLISVCGGVEIDTFVQDANDGCYFEGRDIDEVDAWMPLPEPYKQEVENG